MSDAEAFVTLSGVELDQILRKAAEETADKFDQILREALGGRTVRQVALEAWREKARHYGEPEEEGLDDEFDEWWEKEFGSEEVAP